MFSWCEFEVHGLHKILYKRLSKVIGVGKKKYDVLIDEYSHTWECKAPLMRFIKESSGGKYSLTDAQKMLNGELPQTIITGIDKDMADSVVAKIKELGGKASIKESAGDNESTSAQRIKSSYLFTKDEPLKCAPVK